MWKLVKPKGGRGERKRQRQNEQGWPCRTNYLDASRATFTHCVGHSSTGRIDHGDKAQEAELLGGEVHVVAVEGVSSRKLGRRQIHMAEACGGGHRGKDGWGGKEHCWPWKVREKKTCFSRFNSNWSFWKSKQSPHSPENAMKGQFPEKKNNYKKTNKKTQVFLLKVQYVIFGLSNDF